MKTKVAILNCEFGFMKLSVIYDGRADLAKRKGLVKAASPFPSPKMVNRAVLFAEKKIVRRTSEGEGSKKNLFYTEPQRRDSLCLGGMELFGSLVGSYEESILTGRMSTMPSKPVEFIAEIGVLGHGKQCPSHLRCPSHLFVPFSAFFYELPGEEVPTPFVGLIDISKSLFSLPSKGQLQIMIRNLNNTVIKIFLLSFDFSDMPPFSKTFLRQKSLGVAMEDAKNSRLKHAVHVNFQKISSSNLTLMSPLRVVFSSGSTRDEKIENILDGPSDPKYSLIMDSSHSTMR